MKTAIIAGAGPAGLTAASELLKHGGVKPVVFEMSGEIGGISKTVNFKGNRIDIGGHRFFSKSERVMRWWMEAMPPEREYPGFGYAPPQGEAYPDPGAADSVMLVRERLSRIFYLRSFFNYPLSLSKDTLLNLGAGRSSRILGSFIRSSILPRREENNLEDFMINRFGRELYTTFFRDYTEKVWGVKCSEISAEWGMQRIKGLSAGKTLLHAARKLFIKDSSGSQRGIETSLIEKFLYPKLGPGQMWEETAGRVRSGGGELLLHRRVKEVIIRDKMVRAVKVEDTRGGDEEVLEGDYFLSSMPVKDLIASISGDEVPEGALRTAANLPYRDFITVGLLLKKLHVKTRRDKEIRSMVPDNWIYIQERDVKLGRLQIFNNWSPYMVKDPDTVWLGLEYFCAEGDGLWNMEDKDLADFAAMELAAIDFIKKEDVLDAVVLRVPKTYPAYFGAYSDFDLIRDYTDGIENLFLIGRNGMHKYNNADHSMLTAMEAADNISSGIKSKDNIWSVNTEAEYHEKK